MHLKVACVVLILIGLSACRTTPPQAGYFKPACTQHPYDAGICDIPVKWSGFKWLITGNGE
jgi:hypothetical protein